MTDEADPATRRRPAASRAFGPNAWLVDDMYEQYRQDPQVGERELAGVLLGLPARGSQPGSALDTEIAGCRQRSAGRGRNGFAAPATAPSVTTSAAPTTDAPLAPARRPRRRLPPRPPPRRATGPPHCGARPPGSWPT
jgi:2-oxoglutarate decarboxylase